MYSTVITIIIIIIIIIIKSGKMQNMQSITNIWLMILMQKIILLFSIYILFHIITTHIFILFNVEYNIKLLSS